MTACIPCTGMASLPYEGEQKKLLPPFGIASPLRFKPIIACLASNTMCILYSAGDGREGKKVKFFSVACAHTTHVGNGRKRKEKEATIDSGTRAVNPVHVPAGKLNNLVALLFTHTQERNHLSARNVKSLSLGIRKA